MSYLAISQYAVAALQPPALRAICPWEGFTDAYRDLAFPGGIRESGFTRLWSRGVRRRTRQTYDMEQMQEAHPLRDDFWRSRVPDLSAIKVPMLVCGSFSDNNLHSRGSIRAFTRSGCGHARLYTHRGGKWETFYSATALSEQLKFLRDALAGSSGSRSVRLEVREDRDTITAVREETQWPLAGTRWRPMYLAGPGLLATEPPPTAGSIRFQTRSRAAAFNWTIPEDIELTGPMAARLWVQLDGCDDANLFVGVEKWRDGQFVAFEGSYGWGRDRVTTGWQRVSLRELDPELAAMGAGPGVCSAPAGHRRRGRRRRCRAWPVGDIVPRRRTVTTGGWRTLVVPPQPAHRPIPGRLPTPAAWSCHAALGPTLRRAPADTGGPWVARVAERWLTARVTRAASVTSPSKTPHAVTSPR